MTRDPATLRTTPIHGDYRSDRTHLVEDFYLPALAASTRYDRAVGYFNASVLAVLGHGLEEFAHRSGYMRIVASPQLRTEDIDQLRAGYALRAVLEHAALRDLHQAAEDPQAAAGIGQLGRLVAHGRLDIKLAYILDRDRVGIYHEKIGVFHDTHDTVAFKGSANETLPGLVGNFESIEVFRSWLTPDRERAQRITRDFDDLWHDRTQFLRVFTFTDAARPLLDEYATRTAPRTPRHAPLPDGTLITLPRPHPDGTLAIPPGLTVRDYQKHAVEAWFAHGCRGILRMATGTGKTVTALTGGAQLAKQLAHHDAGPLLTVVVAPYQHLVDQWATDVERFGVTPIRAYESVDTWHNRASALIDALALRATSGGLIVTTNATFAGDTFQTLLARHRGHLLMIADEVHNLGAHRLRDRLPHTAAYRLGLSATPERWFDDTGTAALRQYFGDIVFEMGIGDAIQAGALCRYTYTPVLVELDDEESELYGRVTEAIAKALATHGNADEADADSPLGMLLRKRANILGHARAKIPALREQVLLRRDHRHQLLYCAEGRHPLATDIRTTDEPTQLHRAMDLVGRELRMPTASYTAQTPRPQRLELLHRFASGDDLQVLASMRCLDEGVDIPAARTAYLLASSSNPRQFIQRRGRVLRRAPGKTHADIVDFVVIPPDDEGGLRRETERRMVARELTRVTEFARFSDNETTTLDTLRPLRTRFGLHDV
ncbi:DEAD/DEAH box helicase family protein [Embleya scabrispora]|uniref:DEAD/DEAH box helicase family protein n=1 Tax=Embleya scabrispora TaxID=159449 RepID=UPI0003642D42|nr:DEAD/DEAH box helicase family protein [Embleya scabrispora]MYS87878.1 DEAD/DEAH box helicase family protein [Streptomyces sp. SID5474]